VRVVAGTLGGRRLHAPKGHGTRPTADRVKEALFSMLGSVVEASVLDLYAGTGALGVEALSRGASKATFVEHAPLALSALRRNVEELGLGDRAVIVAQRIERARARVEALGPFDVVLADPPYADVADCVTALEALVAARALSAGAVVVVEHGSRDAVAVEGLERLETRAYGDTALTFLRSPGG
jgi:16S rRNA (guanine966-N2)-methyltransferase